MDPLEFRDILRVMCHDWLGIDFVPPRDFRRAKGRRDNPPEQQSKAVG